MSPAPYTITTPIYYVNGDPHIGHTYTTIVADTLARYRRLCGEDVVFLTGTDEHGEKIREAAAAEGVSPKDIADRYSAVFRSTWDAIGLRYDRFIRTTDEAHRRVVQGVLQRIHDAGEIEFREYEGLYCVGCERFLTERDMVDGLCRDHERAPERRAESNYFFLMTRHFAWLEEVLESRPDFVRPERYRNEVLGMLREESGLGDLCISRPKERLDWGIELPFDRDYVCYVWFDALINYLSGLGYPDAADFATHWSGAEHLIGKDILKPHAVFWPTMLHALGLELPRHVNVHGYWNQDERKVSKSTGNRVSPGELFERYGLENVRYFLLREMAFGQDATFNEEALVARSNADLANKLGNLLSRTLNMTGRFCEGRIPEPDPPGELEHTVREAFADAARAVDAHMRAMEIHRALDAPMRAVDAANRYLEQREPWKAAKDPARAGEVRTALHTCCEALRVAALLLSPFLPRAAEEILAGLGLDGALAKARLPEDAAWGGVRPGAETRRGAPLFPRLESPEAES